MSPRKYVPLIIGALLLTALLLLYFSRSMNWNWDRVSQSDGVEPIEPAGGQRIAQLSTDLYVNVSLPNSDYTRLVERTERFMMEYPHIRVEISNERNSAGRYEHLLAMSNHGTAPDVMLLDNGGIVPLAVKGLLKPVDSLMTGDVLSDQLPRLMEPLKWNGYLWGVPYRINPYMVAWSKELLAEAGLSEPPDRWEAFQALAEKIASASNDSVPEEERYLMNFNPDEFEQLLVWSSRLNGVQEKLINLHALPEQVQDSLVWLQSTGPVASIPSHRNSELNELIQAHRLLMLVLPWEQLNSLSQSARNKLNVEQEHIYYPWLNGASFVIGSGSRSEGEAMLWIQEMTSPYSSLKEFEEGGKLPVRPSLYDQMRLITKSGDAPPYWWLEALSAKAPQIDSVAPDPEWPKRWRDWSSTWKAAGMDTGRLTAFVQWMTAEESKK
ncbi:extracellular solute-binding protein [Paenibacillus paeoniae]|uniref:Extracellular solute-binding protein n=1 Tax=Paenibacillus paeoniae TaxID=2292705 RepID=A0A371PJ41_9BACL|nr:extracellular solute-binding protein [Paenibacillus paeoniae]REK76230.1 extracellular solute-binding protein [Paenibacillus paeoniae]